MNNPKRYKTFTHYMSFWESVWHLVTRFEWKTRDVIYVEVSPVDCGYDNAPYQVEVWMSK